MTADAKEAEELAAAAEGLPPACRGQSSACKP